MRADVSERSDSTSHRPTAVDGGQLMVAGPGTNPRNAMATSCHSSYSHHWYGYGSSGGDGAPG